MRVRISNSNLGRRFYIIKTYYDTKGIERTLTVENLGSEHEIREQTGRDPLEWAKERAVFLTKKEKEENQDAAFQEKVDHKKSSVYLSDWIFVPAKDLLRSGAGPDLCFHPKKIRFFFQPQRYPAEALLWQNSGSSFQSRHLRVFQEAPAAAGL